MIQDLIEYLKNLNSVAVAFSSGVDSTFLLKSAQMALGNNVVAITLCASTFPERELDSAIEFCKINKIKHIVEDFDIYSIKEFSQNSKDRCYYCKKAMFERMLNIANELGIGNIIEGSNIDDNRDYRPGIRALRELGIKSPLAQLSFSKEKIRTLSKKLNLNTYSKSSFACLASRVAYGEVITPAKIDMIDRAEQLLSDMKFNQFRARIHDNNARIEIKPNEFEKLIQNRDMIINEFKKIGFNYISMDLEGYRCGSMNEILNKKENN